MTNLILNYETVRNLKLKSPYNFDANVHKPSHFPSTDGLWEEGKHWISMVWKSRFLGIKLENKGVINNPLINVHIFSSEQLSEDFIDSLIEEIKWRFNFEQDISEFCDKFEKDNKVGEIIKKWKGMKPIAANSLYETLIIYLVLQNATVRRSVQMLENLFNKFGKKIEFDGKVLSTFWEPEEMARATEQELRDLKVGYRAKFFMRITQQFVNKEIDEFKLRKMPKEDVKEEMLKLYGIGPASVEYLLFEDFYFLDALATIPPWEQKIMSMLLFNKKIISANKILNFFKKFKPYQKLAFHYVWEDIFWKRKNEHIDWLEKEIRL